jgi:hypothetical protein
MRSLPAIALVRWLIGAVRSSAEFNLWHDHSSDWMTAPSPASTMRAAVNRVATFVISTAPFSAPWRLPVLHVKRAGGVDERRARLSRRRSERLKLLSITASASVAALQTVVHRRVRVPSSRLARPHGH